MTDDETRWVRDLLNIEREEDVLLRLFVGVEEPRPAVANKMLVADMAQPVPAIEPVVEDSPAIDLGVADDIVGDTFG